MHHQVDHQLFFHQLSGVSARYEQYTLLVVGRQCNAPPPPGTKWNETKRCSTVEIQMSGHQIKSKDLYMWMYSYIVHDHMYSVCFLESRSGVAQQIGLAMTLKE